MGCMQKLKCSEFKGLGQGPHHADIVNRQRNEPRNSELKYNGFLCLRQLA